MVEVAVVWEKLQLMVVKLEVVWVKVVVVGTPILLVELHFVEKPVLLPLRHPTGVKSVGYIQDSLFLRSCKYFHFA